MPAKCARTPRVSHAGTLTDDQGLVFTLGLTALPKTTHLGTYSWRVSREANQKLLSGLVQALRLLGLAAGQAGINCDFHAIRHHGDQAVLEKHYVPRRSQRTRAVLTFFAQDHATSDMVYSNADITKAEQAREIIAFADYGSRPPDQTPGCWSSTSCDHLQDPRRAVRPRHPLADPAPARQDRTCPAG